MNFSTAISTCLTKYVKFDGRATRSEFWWFVLFTALLGIGAGIIGYVVEGEEAADSFGNFAQLLVLLPSLAVGSRRLHDIGKSGWWQLISLTIIGLLPLMYWWVKASQPEANAYNES